jgi:membrane-bound lytic murein transglycosylase D
MLREKKYLSLKRKIYYGLPQCQMETNVLSGVIRMIRLKLLCCSISFVWILSCSYPMNVTPLTLERNNGTSLYSLAKADILHAENLTSANPSSDTNEKPAKSISSAAVPSVNHPTNSSKGPGAREDSSAENARQVIHEKETEKSAKARESNGQENLDAALDLLTQARGLWEKGELDDALALLDEAYELILDVNGDPEWSRQKDDLRFMISKLIVQIVASRHRVTAGKQSEIPLLMNADVEKEIRSFQTIERAFFLRSYHRSGLYLPVILKQLEEAGLPKELAWLPLVESGFQVHVLSRARALGLWQFIPSTGYKFDLKRDRWIDERMDVDKSTKAAIAYLKELHGLFGDWMTVLAAYNCGEGRVLRVISKQHINYLDNFWDLYRQLPHETARYVPRFLATLHIIKNPRKYGMDLSENPDKPTPYEVVKSGKCMRLEDIAKHLSISKDVMTYLNSELRLQLTPEREYDLKVPTGTAKKYVSVSDQIPKWEPPRVSKRYIRHRVRRGETLGSLARRYHVTRNEIASANHISMKRALRVGQRIRVPVDDYGPALAKTKGKKYKKVKASAVEAGKVLKYKVRKGDTLQSIAARSNTSVAEIRELNGIKGNKILVNQVIRIKGRPVAKAETAVAR